MVCLFVAFVLAILALGRWSPRGPRDFLDWKPTRAPEVEAENEVDDVAEMLAAQNAFRRRRGLAERTEADVLETLRRDRAELEARAAEHDRPPLSGPAS
jgi:hypothetical protein